MVHELHRLTFLKMMAQKEEDDKRKAEEEERKRKEEAAKAKNQPKKPNYTAPRMRPLEEKQTPPVDPNDPMSNPTVRMLMGAEVQETLEEALNLDQV